MGAQERANRILAAWVAGNSDSLKVEIQEALLQAKSPQSGSILENEEQELLETVASDLWASLVRTPAEAHQELQSSFALLRHLSHRASVCCRNGGSSV